jgi:RNA-binding protein Musashi
VRHHFSQFGPVLEAIVVHDPVTNRSKQFAFVTFDYAETADHALRSRGMVIDGRQIEVCCLACFPFTHGFLIEC